MVLKHERASEGAKKQEAGNRRCEIQCVQGPRWHVTTSKEARLGHQHHPHGLRGFVDSALPRGTLSMPLLVSAMYPHSMQRQDGLGKRCS